MTTAFLIEYIAEVPSAFIRPDGGVTFQWMRAARFASRELAEAEISRLKLNPMLWNAICRALPDVTSS